MANYFFKILISKAILALESALALALTLALAQGHWPGPLGHGPSQVLGLARAWAWDCYYDLQLKL